ncbi:MAG: rhamnulokinase family protein [Bryobacterales bacterium]
MSSAETYIAIDLGAGSGRVMAGHFDGERIALEELHRFPNPGVRVVDGLHWDVLRLWEEIQVGLRHAAPQRPVSAAVDTWGVDFALLDRLGGLVGNPYNYRDARTNGLLPKVLDIVSREEIFDQTGLQFMEINTLFQLYSMKNTAALDAADALLMMPDLFHYWLTGVKVCEYSDATTTQFYDPRKKAWAKPLLEKLGLPTHILREVVQPGTKLGPVLPSVAEACGLNGMSVVAPASHDTGSAVAAVPASGRNWAFLSSGTWSLLGAEIPEPRVTAKALEKNFTNEGGVWGTTRLLKNICGLWLLEECRREWALAGDRISYEELIAAAEAAPPFRSLFDVDAPVFVAPDGMPQRIADWCSDHGQPAPRTPGEFARAIFESLALKYRQTLDDLGEIVGERAQTLHVVGGGSQNEMLSQYAADACGVEVVAGPVEATALGNVLVQAVGMGRVADGAQVREIVRRSFEPKRYEPRGGRGWDEAAGRLREVLS